MLVYLKTLICQQHNIKEMKKKQVGEITGHMFDIDGDTTQGMPLRSAVNIRRKEPSNISSVDLMVDALVDSGEQPTMINYYDPSSSHFNTNFIDNLQQTTQSSEQQIGDEFVNNVNTFGFNLFNTFCQQIQQNFVLCTLGVLNLVIHQDDTLKYMIEFMQKNGIFIENKLIQQIINNRVSLNANLSLEYYGRKYMYFEDNNCRLVEIPMNNSEFVIGFMTDKHQQIPSISKRRLDFCISHLRLSTVTITGKSFQYANKLNLNQFLIKSGYLKSKKINHIQTIVVQIHINFTDASEFKMSQNLINNEFSLNGNFVYYVRSTKFGIILFFGQQLI